MKRAFSFASTLVLCLLLAVSSAAVAEQSDAAAGLVSGFEVGFSPRGRSLDIILRAIDEAQQSIRVAAYSFTSKPIAAALTQAHERGVEVMVVADAKSNSGKHSVVGLLAGRGVPVRVNGRYSIFHHKYMVIDGQHLETGSFNYSAAAAEHNAENVLLLRDAPQIAEIYAAEWQRLWDECTPQEKKY